MEIIYVETSIKKNQTNSNLKTRNEKCWYFSGRCTKVFMYTAVYCTPVPSKRFSSVHMNMQYYICSLWIGKVNVAEMIRKEC